VLDEILKTWFVGVDTHKDEHTAGAMDAFHQTLCVVQTPNNPRYFDQFVAQLEMDAPADVQLVFGLEDTQGLGRSLAQWLVQQGYEVREVNPVYTDRERAHSPNPDKSDPRDALAIAEVLYRKWQDLPRVQPNGRQRALKHALAAREQLVRQKTRVKNQLHLDLHAQYPQYRAFFSDPFGVAARAFFTRFPSPAHLQGQGPHRLGAFLSKQTRNLGRAKAEHILALVDKDADRDRATDTRDIIIQSLYQQLAFLEQQEQLLAAEIATLLEESDYQLRTMKGLGDILAATFEAEVGSVDRFASASKLARYAGVAPADHSSGSRGHKKHRIYGNRHLNRALYLLALSQIQATRSGRFLNPEARRYYEKKIAEGKSKKAALRCLMRRLVDVIYAMMRDRSAYRLPEAVPPPAIQVI